MLFNSLTFFALFLPTLAAYWALPWQRARLALLLAASLLFYGYHHWPSVFLLLFTIGFNYAAGRRQQSRPSRVTLLVAVGVNLSLLLWFKYAAFIATMVNSLLAVVGLNLAVPVPRYIQWLGMNWPWPAEDIAGCRALAGGTSGGAVRPAAKTHRNALEPMFPRR